MTRGLWTTLLVLAIVSTAVSSAQGQSLETIDFDDHPASPVDTPGVDLDPDFYADRGVRFSRGATVLAYEEGFTASGSNGLEMCYAVEFCSIPFLIAFDSPQSSVSVSIGYSGSLDEEIPVLMLAYDVDGAPVDADEALLGPGSPVPTDLQLTVGPTDARTAAAQGSDGHIEVVEIRWSDSTRAMNSLVIDDLVYEPFVQLLEFTVEPSVLSFGTTEEAREVLITNVGNVVAAFGVILDGDADAFELDDTSCRVDLAPGSSCSLSVRFNPPAEGEYSANVVLISSQLGEIQVIPIDGTLAAEGGPSETTDPDATTDTTGFEDTGEAGDDPGDTTADDEETGETISGAATADEEGSPLVIPLAILIVLVAAVGGALLVRLRPKRRSRNNRDTDRAAGIATVRVSPGQSASQVTIDERQPVTAIRVKTGNGTTTLNEEDRP